MEASRRRTRRNMGSSIAVVYLADGTIQTYNACTYPSDLSRYPTIPEGGYEASVGEHKGSYPALKMYDIGKKMDDNTINLGFANPAHPNRTNAIGINIHKAGRENVTGMTQDGDPISAGCMLIDINQWDEFIGHFNNDHQRNNTVGVIISRSSSSPIRPTYLKYYPYKYVDGMY